MSTSEWAIDLAELKAEAARCNPLPDPPRSALEITAAELEPLRAFLAARLREAVAAQPPGSPTRRLLNRLARLTDLDCLDLENHVSAWECDREDGLAWQSDAFIDLGTVWNSLMDTAAIFADHPDYLPRWRRLPYAGPEHPRARSLDKLFTADGGHEGRR
ncbi:hypothetical protein AB0I82_35205 [Streptomyces sp. NPDC050315]|uniref:hypothetical protein n=1 Tax=Streptomyces sp. NPDC050315 TaxID=3155039 RepID=UPI0034417CBF